MDDSLNICLPCGLCCDGTAVGFVELNKEEMPAVKEFMDIEDENGNGFFLQPCDKYCNGCTVYSKRPKHCASFKCQLLKSVESRELDFDLAIKMVDEIKAEKVVLEQKIASLPFELKSPSFFFKLFELRKMLLKKQSESPLVQSDIDLLSDLNQFDSLMTKNLGLPLF